MARYCVNRNSQANGDHEVHNLDAGCSYLPAPSNQLSLGHHTDCSSAVRQAKTIFTQSNGCAYCAAACHTR